MESGGKLILFLSRHFEEITYALAALLSHFLGMYVIYQFKRRPLGVQVRSYVETAIGSTLIFLLLFGSTLILAIYWANYKSPYIHFDLYDSISRNANWVREDLTIYLVNDNELIALSCDGNHQEVVFTSDEEPIRQFEFSPHGRYILVSTYKKLFMIDTEEKKDWLVDQVQLPGSEEDLKGSISGISWSPAGDRFSYELSRWSNFGSQAKVYIYDINDRSKKSIDSPTRRLGTLYWDLAGENLYYLKQASSELEERQLVYKLKVYRVDLSDLEVHFVDDIMMEEENFSPIHLSLLGIKLYQPERGLTFDRLGNQTVLKSRQGHLIGIDRYNYFFYQGKWFRRRLFRVKRDVDTSKKQTMVNAYGEHVLRQIRWTPSGRYVVMDHSYWGILIMDPRRQKVAQIYPYDVNVYGWFSEI